MDEWALLQKIKRMIPASTAGETGIGDDADSITLTKGPIMVTTDAIVEDVDFKFKQARAEEIGHKLLAINLSDLAAMGAKPECFVLTLGLSKKVSDKWVMGFYRGLISLAQNYRLRCLGGDLSSSKQIFASLALIGRKHRKIILRSSARHGDAIAVTGNLGGSILGRHLNFMPRVRESLFLTERFPVNAMIDISDGFVQDLEHILQASEKSAEIDISNIPISGDARRLSRKSKKPALIHALTDGEDFELLFTVPLPFQDKIDSAWKRKYPGLPLSWVGRIISGSPSIRWYNKAVRCNISLKKKGYTHFAET